MEQGNVKFSVVIPLYNKGKYIERTIKCVLAQTNQDFEIVVVDDGSTDDSLAVARSVQSKKLIVLTQPNQGVSVARNYGIAHAKGDYIAFLDADDVWCENYLETIDFLTERYTKSDLFVTSYVVDMGDGRYHYSTQRMPETGCLSSYWMTLADRYDFVWTSATTVRKEAIVKAGGFRPGEKIGQDLDMWARVARINPRVAYSSNVCVTYNRSAEENARSRVKIAWASAFLKDLEQELKCNTHTPEELCAIQKKYDKKMTVYIFTSVLAGETKRAMSELKNWCGKKTMYNQILRAGLIIACVVPKGVNQRLYNLRLKLF